MELWIRSTAKTNLCKVSFLTIMLGEKFYEKSDWEYTGYTIVDCNNGKYRLLGTYKTKERALEVLDEIQGLFIKKDIVKSELNKDGLTIITTPITYIVYEMPKD